MIKVGIKVQLKKEVLDTKGRTLLKLLQKRLHPVKECRYGKYIELHLKTKNKKTALKQANSIAKDVLHNSLIESFTIEILN